MSFVTTTHRRGLERFLAIVSAFAVFMSLMVMFAPAALAHHPEISANQTCVGRVVSIAYESVSWKTDGTPGSGHPDIRIEVQLNGAGSWTEVAGGAYNAGNNYQFSGTFDAQTYLGEDIQVRARSVGPWDNGTGGGQITTSSAIVVNLDCTQAVTVTANPQVCEVVQGAAQGAVSFGISPASGATVQVYQNANFTGPVGGALGDGALLNLAPGTYYWQATASGGFDLGNSSSGQFTIDPCSASTVVVSGDCVVNQQGAPQGSVTVTIDPTSGATVVITGPGGPYDFSGSGGSQHLAPGSYTWTATPGSGFVLSGAASGGFSIEPCDVSVLVADGQCELVNGPQGAVTVSIDAASGATVTVSDHELQVAATFSGSGGSSKLAPGTYTWVATPGDGFDFPGGQATTGTFTIDPCEGTVIVTHGNCAPNSASASGSVTVSIDPDGAAKVTVFNSSSLAVAGFTAAGGTHSLAAGDYTWVAEAEAGFQLSGVSSGGFAVVACPDQVLDEVLENEDEVEAVVVLPFTGVDAELLLGASIILLGSGLFLIRYARRREEG